MDILELFQFRQNRVGWFYNKSKIFTKMLSFAYGGVVFLYFFGKIFSRVGGPGFGVFCNTCFKTCQAYYKITCLGHFCVSLLIFSCGLSIKLNIALDTKNHVYSCVNVGLWVRSDLELREELNFIIACNSQKLTYSL